MVSYELQVMAAAGTWNMTLGLMPAHSARLPSFLAMCRIVPICTRKTAQVSDPLLDTCKFDIPQVPPVDDEMPTWIFEKTSKAIQDTRELTRLIAR